MDICTATSPPLRQTAQSPDLLPADGSIPKLPAQGRKHGIADGEFSCPPRMPADPHNHLHRKKWRRSCQAPSREGQPPHTSYYYPLSPLLLHKQPRSPILPSLWRKPSSVSSQYHGQILAMSPCPKTVQKTCGSSPLQGVEREYLHPWEQIHSP